MRAIDIIAKKRNGLALSPEEIYFLVDAYVKDDIPDYQMAAWLMAVYLKGMNQEEISVLTMAMAKSGNLLDLSTIPGVKVDKHSTGGVADTTTLVLAPLIAAAGVPVAKMSGRGLGFTGGTIDKLQSIPGFNVQLSRTEFLEQVARYNIAITAQSNDIAPADGKIYALRDATATVESIPLIASSIMSKKIAAGADKILLDVKVGNGAFMKNLDDGIALATCMVKIGNYAGRETRAIITSMDQPLGNAVGNSLEVEEAISVLSGKGSGKLKEACLVLGSHIMVMADAAVDVNEGYDKLLKLLEDGSGLRKFRDLVKAQGGNVNIIDEPHLLPQAKYKLPVESISSGFVQSIDAEQIGYCAMLLGAGRIRKEQSIDLAVGITMKCGIGEYVRKGELLAILHANDVNTTDEVRNLLIRAIKLGEDKPQFGNEIVMGIVDNDGFKSFPQMHNR